MSGLKSLYVDEPKNLWSANDQMEKVVSKMADAASDKTLADRLGFAEALGENGAAQKLGDPLDDIYDSDGFMTELAERSRNVDAAG